MKTRIAFLGFRHGHICDAYRRACERPDVEVVACSEEDAVVVGAVFSRHGAIVADALAAGRHVLTDKPACTSLAELDRIEDLARTNGRVVGMILEMRDAGVFIGMRRLVRDGAIGEVRAVAFGGQHPLLSASRPSWYHEPGSHGGTINDIAVHAIDLIPWATGLRFARVVAAREWQRGVLETGLNARQITLFKDGESMGKALPPGPPDPGGYLESFLREARGERGAPADEARLTMADVFAASRVALRAQEAASRGLRDVEV